MEMACNVGRNFSFNHREKQEFDKLCCEGECLMDIDKLIEQLRWWADNCDRTNYGCQARPFLLDAATALSTLKGENEKLRETVDKYATAARAIALHLKPFCDESLPYDEMIADAARKASDELEQVKAERDAAVKCIEKIEDALNFQRMSAIGLRISEWRGQKED